jgi:Protein of unknown function (DUF3209)
MACHELAGLRLGLMKIVGIDDEAERQHELAELGDGATKPGPIKSLSEAGTLEDLKKFFDASLSDLEQKVSGVSKDDPKLPYLRTLVVLSNKVSQDLTNQVEGMKKLYNDLEEIHDLVHEIYPAG